MVRPFFILPIYNITESATHAASGMSSNADGYTLVGCPKFGNHFIWLGNITDREIII